MKAIKLFALLFLAVGCTPNEDAVDCNCGTITKVEANPTNTQWKYTLKSDCGDVTTYESRVEILQVGSRKCN
jgi:hypothetical protein